MDGYTNVFYNTQSDALLERLECLIDDLNHDDIEEVNYGSGVLTIDTVKNGSFVVNKQAPKLQLWLSSPISGPHHYDMVKDAQGDGVQWVCERDGHLLVDKMKKEFAELGISLDL